MGVPAVVISFDPHPISVLRPESAPPGLSTAARKEELLLGSGADAVLIFRTTRALLELSADEFFERIVVDRLRARALVEGPNFGFGRGRAGNIETLGRLCRDAKIDLDVVEILAGVGEPVSSSRIRAALSAGDVESARAMLGRPHQVSGVVAHGARRGEGLGFPTANLEAIGALLPEDGVYAVAVRVDGARYAGACNIGPNPTFAEHARKVEVHLLDFTGDLYGKTIALDLLARVRDTRPFSDVAQLQRRLQQDVAQVRATVGAENTGADSERLELSNTILEWLRQEIEPGLAGLGGRIDDARLDSTGRLRIEFSARNLALPTDAFALLAEIDKPLRHIFPEVREIEPTTDSARNRA